MNKTYFALCGIMLCLISGIFFLESGVVSAQTETTDAAKESGAQQEVEEMVKNGTFDRTKLTDAQVDYIYDTYGEDAQAISELQKESDSNKASLASVDADSYTHDSQFDGYDIINGIDVSRFQGTIDWEKVKADGIDFALIRVAFRYAGSGKLEADANYKENIEGAIAAGLDVGVYIYSQAITTAEAKEEADYAISLVKGYNITLPIVMDFEYYTGNTGRLANANLSTAAATAICKAFCKEVESKKYTSMVYANKSLLTNDVNASALANKYQIWLAQYPGWDSATGSYHATYEGKYSYWQYTSSGSVSGVSGRVDMDFRYIKKPSAVKNLTWASASMRKITITWDKVPYVYGYRIYRLNNETGVYELVGKTKGPASTSYTDSGLDPDTAYSYKVRAYYKLKEKSYYSDYSSLVNASTEDKTVTGVSVSKRTSSAITITWSAQSEVSGYRIYRLDETTGAYKNIATVSGADTTAYTDTGLTCGTSYTYKVRAYYIMNESKLFFHSSSAVTGTTRPGQTTGVTVSATYNSAAISWNPQTNVAGYKIYVKADGASKWTRIKTIKDKTVTTYTHKKLKSNTLYTYSVIAYYKKNGTNTNASRSDSVTVLTNPGAVKNFAAAPKSNGKYKLTWKKASGVDGYRIYAKENTSGAKWTRIATIQSSEATSYTASGLDSKNGYRFKIRAYRSYNGSICFGKNTTVLVNTSPKKVTGVSVRVSGSTQLLSWKTVSYVDGYYIYRYNKKTKKYTKIATVKGSGKSSYTIKKVTSSNYTYHVAAYASSGKKTYVGKKSAAATVKTTRLLKVTSASLNVRSGAGTGYKILTTVSKGTILTKKGSSKNGSSLWYKVKFEQNGKTYTGYVSGNYVTSASLQ